MHLQEEQSEKHSHSPVVHPGWFIAKKMLLLIGMKEEIEGELMNTRMMGLISIAYVHTSYIQGSKLIVYCELHKTIIKILDFS